VIKRHFILVIFILFYILIQLFLNKSYGISWDEEKVYTRGKYLYEYLIEKNVNPAVSETLLNPGKDLNLNPFYNNTYALILYVLNKSQNYDIYHLLNSLSVIPLFIAIYLLIYSLYKNQWFAILGPLTLILTPSFFGHIPINPKDIPFATAFFSSLSAVYFFSAKSNRLLRILILGILFGITQSLRVVGFSLYIILFLNDLYVYYTKDTVDKTLFEFIKEEFLSILLIFLIANYYMVITWPYIGVSYFKHFIRIFYISQDFPWEGTVLFFGQNLSGHTLPLIFIPLLILFTTPLFILFYFFSSVFFVKKIWSNKIIMLCIFALVTNLVLYFVLQPNALLRHFLYFIPIIVIIATISFIEFLKNSKHYHLKNFILIVSLINILIVTYHIVLLHPYQLIYYNELVGGIHGADSNFPLGIWSSADKEASLWLRDYLSNQKLGEVKIFTCNNPNSSSDFFSKNMRLVTKVNEANYAICGSKTLSGVKFQIIHEVKRENTTLDYVFKIK